MATLLSARTVRVLVVLAAAALASVALLLAHGPQPPTLDQRVESVADDLRCPTCVGESAAQSNSPMARSMRSEVREQLMTGRSPDQVRNWFRDRYGQDILMAPAGQLRWLPWVAPLLVLAGAVVLVARRRRLLRAPPSNDVSPPRLGGGALLLATSVLVVAGLTVTWFTARPSGERPTSATTSASPSTASPVEVAARLDDAGRYGEAVPAWEEALRRAPTAGVIRTRLAFDLLRSGHPSAVSRVVEGLAKRKNPQRPTALLVLGLSQRALGKPQAATTLRAFLAAAPNHPAGAQVRRLLAER